ncbi:ribonuclease H, partial [Trifolium pratense]
MKLPAVVTKKIIRIQREFLWGDVKGGRKISWVSWKEVCKPRSQGGLGVRDVGKGNREVGLLKMLAVEWEMGTQQEGWCAPVGVGEEDMLGGLLAVLPVLVLSNVEDDWQWALEDGGRFMAR